MALAPLAPLAFVAAFITAAPLTTETQFVASAVPTHFAATNPNDYTVLMILGDAAHGARAQMLVAPHMSFETSFPTGTLDDLYIEVVFFAPTGRKTSGAVSFDDMMTAGAEYLEVENTSGQVQAWIYSGGIRLNADSGLNLAPSGLLNSILPPTLPIMVDPSHVPVITPDDIYNNTVAPKIHPAIPPI